MRKKSVLKLIFLAPFVALILSTSIFFVENYPKSYTNIIKFFNKKLDFADKFFEKDIAPSPPLLQIDEEELFSRLEKRIKKSTVNAMTQSTAFDILEATVRVTAGSSIGTGVIIFDEKIDSISYSYIITNSHVISDSDEVDIECFTYLKKQTISSTTTYKGRVIANDRQLDLALIQVMTPESIGKSVVFETPDLVTNLTLYQPVYIAGCALAKPPLVTEGHVANITTISSVITAFSIFGNSGGGVYTTCGELVGIVRGVSMVQVPPRGIQIPEPNLTHMIPGPLVRSWLIVGGFSFLIDSESLLTHNSFLNQQKALILEQQEKRAAEKAKKAAEEAKKAKTNEQGP